jgi:hypothetical protein
MAHTNKAHYQVVEQVFSALLSATEKWFALRVVIVFSLLGTKACDELIIDD